MSEADAVFPRRCAGVLLHPASLPRGAGSQLDQAHRFVDWLCSAGFSVWQMLPLHPADGDGSPYSSCSAYAGDPRLLQSDAGQTEPAPEPAALADFAAQAADWLHDYARFRVLKALHQDRPWWEWAAPLRRRETQALAEFDEAHAAALEAIVLEQFRFDRQWRALRAYAAARGVTLIGDLPFLIAADSVEVWCRPEFFELDQASQPLRVAGVPPDYFSATGQRWGNPLYRWDRLEDEGFAWWIARLRHELRWFDVLRLDHFRGLCAVWAIPAHAATAEHGSWEAVPGHALLQTLQSALGGLPLIAEDLGIITPDVVALRDAFGLPGMRILQFAWSDPHNPYLPHNHRRNTVAYTGTHDNDTLCGWYARLDAATRAMIDRYLGYPREPMPWPLIRATLASVAQCAVVPLQDLLELDSAARMNIPGTTHGNWQWRFDWPQVPEDLAARLLEMNRLYARCA